MASFSEEDGMLRLPAASPCRRDYQLRSFSSDCDSSSSRPQSPWLPRSQFLQSEEAMSPFRLYECSAAPRDRANFLSEPLPNPSPLPSYFSGAPVPGVWRRQLVLSSSFAGWLPEMRSSGLESSCREEEVAGSGDDDQVGDITVPYTSYLRHADESRTRFSPSPTNLGMRQNGRMRNCVSGELGRSFELAQQKAKVARGYKSGEIVGLEIRSDGIFPIPESRKEDHHVREDGVPKHRPSGSLLWEALNDADNEIPSRESSAMVPVPFKWEEASAKVSECSCSKMSYSRTSSASRQARISSAQKAKPDSPSRSYYGGSEKTTETEDAHSVTPAASKLAKSALKARAEDVGSSAVPFKWEVAPGKPKLEEKASSISSETAPTLQLPPRLASASSMKRYSWSPSATPTRARSTNRSLSASLSMSSKHSQEEPPSPSQEATPRPRALSGALSQFGTPQYQSAEYFCEDWSRVRSPTSTLCGPGTPSSSSCSDKSCSRKPSVSFSLSHSGTSAESFDHWSYGDHVSPTSRHPPRHSYTESHEGDPIGNNDGAIVKLRRKLKLASSKPPISPIRAPSEEFFDCQAHALSPSPCRNPKDRGLELPSEEGVEPATRLPYKMPSPAHEMEPKAASASSSPTRPGPEFTNCLALPRFLSKGDTGTVENSSDVARPTSSLEDGYRSPAYKATLELLSPSPNLMSKKSGVKLKSSSSRRRHPHLVEVLCNSLKQSLQRFTKRSVSRTHSIVLYDDQFTKRHQSFMW